MTDPSIFSTARVEVTSLPGIDPTDNRVISKMLYLDTGANVPGLLAPSFPELMEVNNFSRDLLSRWLRNSIQLARRDGNRRVVIGIPNSLAIIEKSHDVAATGLTMTDLQRDLGQDIQFQTIGNDRTVNRMEQYGVGPAFRDHYTMDMSSFPDRFGLFVVDLDGGEKRRTAIYTEKIGDHKYGDVTLDKWCYAKTSVVSGDTTACFTIVKGFGTFGTIIKEVTPTNSNGKANGLVTHVVTKYGSKSHYGGPLEIQEITFVYKYDHSDLANVLPLSLNILPLDGNVLSGFTGEDPGRRLGETATCARLGYFRNPFAPEGFPKKKMPFREGGLSDYKPLELQVGSTTLVCAGIDMDTSTFNMNLTYGHLGHLILSIEAPLTIDLIPETFSKEALGTRSAHFNRLAALAGRSAPALDHKKKDIYMPKERPEEEKGTALLSQP